MLEINIWTIVWAFIAVLIVNFSVKSKIKMSTYSNGSIVHVGSSGEAVGSDVASLVSQLSRNAIAARGKFTIALSGGSLPKVAFDHF